MKIGIISDIHANREALEVVLAALEKRRCDYVVCLGDVVGYGAEPNACCDLVRAHVDAAILGNHDAAVCGRMDYSYYRAAARQALDWHAQTLSDENMAWLRSLPYSTTIEDVAFCHGSPTALEDFEYVFVLEQMQDLIARYDALQRITFIGHSHLCKCFRFDRTSAWEILRTRFECEPEHKYIITAGSVGQPRDYDNRASFVTYDTRTRYFEYDRIPYDIDAAARKIYTAELAVAFGKRLFLGV